MPTLKGDCLELLKRGPTNSVDSLVTDPPAGISTKLMSYLVRLITPPGGTVLDPFMGSGSTGVAAQAEGMRFIGIEQDQTYFDIANHRLKKAE